MHSSRGLRLAYYGLPMLFCVAVHWLGLKMWFSATISPGWDFD